MFVSEDKEEPGHGRLGQHRLHGVHRCDAEPETVLEEGGAENSSRFPFLFNPCSFHFPLIFKGFSLSFLKLTFWREEKRFFKGFWRCCGLPSASSTKMAMGESPSRSWPLF